MMLTLLRDAEGLYLQRKGVRYRGTWLGPGFVPGVLVEVKVYANHIRVMWNGCVGGDDKPGVIWVA